MQPMDKFNNPVGDAEPLDADKMMEMLDKPEVDHVRVFRLKEKDELNIRGQKYVVTKTLSGGRAMIKRRA